MSALSSSVPTPPRSSSPPRVATPQDADLVTRVLVEAFRNDPMWGAWAFPERTQPRFEPTGGFSYVRRGCVALSGHLAGAWKCRRDHVDPAWRHGLDI